MLLPQVVVLAACSYSAFAFVLNKRDPATSYQTVAASIPPTCSNDCTSLTTAATYFANPTSDVGPLCSQAVLSAIGQCITCVQSNASTPIAAPILADLQAGISDIKSKCAAASSPIPDDSTPVPTTTDSSTATDTGSTDSATAAPTTAPSGATTSAITSRSTTSTSTTTRRNGAVGKKADLTGVGGAAALAAFGMVLFA